LAGRFNIDLDTPFEQEIFESADRVFQGARNRAAALRNRATESLDQGGDVPVQNSIQAVEEQIARVEGRGRLGDQGLLNVLRDVEAELSGNFARIGDARTDIHTIINNVSDSNSPIARGSEVALGNIRDAITRDLSDFARNFSEEARTAGNVEAGRAFSQWRASNRIFADGFQKARETKLKQILTKGNATPEVVETVIKAGKRSELNLLHRNLDVEGRRATRRLILRDTLDKTGGIEEANPTRFLNDLNKPKIRRSTNVFFTGREGRELQGLKDYLNFTRRAQDAGVVTPTGQELLAPAAGIAAGLAPKIAMSIFLPIGGGARVYESEAVRNLLVKLANTQGRRGQEEILRQLNPLIQEESRRAKTEDK